MSILFDAAGDRLEAPTGYQVPPIGTLSLWLWPNFAQADGLAHYFVTILDPTDTMPQFSLLKFSDNSLYAGWVETGDHRVVVLTANYTLTTSAWNHLLLTWDDTANATRLYLNGTEIGSQLVTLLTNDTTGFPLVAGNLVITPDAPVNMAGELAEFAIWTRVLTAPEIAALAAGAAASSIGSGLQHYWKFQDVSDVSDRAGTLHFTAFATTTGGTDPVITGSGASAAALLLLRRRRR